MGSPAPKTIYFAGMVMVYVSSYDDRRLSSVEDLDNYWSISASLIEQLREKNPIPRKVQ